MLGGVYLWMALAFGDESGPGVLAYVVAGVAGVAVLFGLFLIVPTLAVCFRRCHDIGAPGSSPSSACSSRS